MFKEIGLEEVDDTNDTTLANNMPSLENEKNFDEPTGLPPPVSGQRRVANSEEDGHEGENSIGTEPSQDDVTSPHSMQSAHSGKQPWYARLAPGRRPRIKDVGSPPPPGASSLPRLTMLVLLIAVILPCFTYNGRGKLEMNGADAGPISRSHMQPGPALEMRADSPTQVCTRWSQQSELSQTR